MVAGKVLSPWDNDHVLQTFIFKLGKKPTDVSQKTSCVPRFQIKIQLIYSSTIFQL